MGLPRLSPLTVCVTVWDRHGSLDEIGLHQMN